MNETQSICPICDLELPFSSDDDFWTCRSQLRAVRCPLGSCSVRERALAHVLFGLFSKQVIKESVVYECSPVMRGLSLHLAKTCRQYHPLGYFPESPVGTEVRGLRNENLEQLTLADSSVDVWLHLDVLEHLFNPFQALREIHRTLKPGGVCLFTVPTYAERLKSEQVAKVVNGELRINGQPEYHGNPQRPEDGALVTWRYGYDLPLQICRETPFDVEVRRWQSKRLAVMGLMTEVYVCAKPL